MGEWSVKRDRSHSLRVDGALVDEFRLTHGYWEAKDTQRIFRNVFNNPDFTRRSVIASEIEKVIDALTSQAFSRDAFLQKLDRFYVAIEKTARTIEDFTQKQEFLNTIYEKFFQGFSVKVADTHGIVYIRVVIGNPPYNAWQLNENDDNKNRKYKVMDKRVAETYAKDSRATNKNALSDPYVKAFRWASDRIGDEGIVAFVSNNSY